MNVTAPFKGEIAALVARRSPEVEALGAANVVTRDKDGLVAHNTDPDGVTGALAAAGVEIRDKNCLVLGAGGAGSAAARALQRAGGRVTIANRNGDKAREVAARLDCAHAALDGEIADRVARAGIIVNALPPGVEIIEKEWLAPRHVVLDAIYHHSYLQERAIAARATYVNGYAWLIHQGIPAYRLFTGKEPDARGMEEALVALPPLPRHVAFVGFMGTGKSTVARLVARKLGMPLADSDRILERRQGKSIPRWIQEEGEPSFRDKEFELLRELLLDAAPSVISCGGGAIMHPVTRQLLRECSLVIWLHAAPRLCVGRIKVATRPLLARHEQPEVAAETIFEERKPLYASVARLLVDTSARSPEQVSQIIHEEIRTCIRG
jgi:shikimate dehydrogenase